MTNQKKTLQEIQDFFLKTVTGKRIRRPVFIIEILIALRKIEEKNNIAAVKQLKFENQFIFYLTASGQLRQQYSTNDQDFLITEWELDKDFEDQTKTTQCIIVKLLGWEGVANG